MSFVVSVSSSIVVSALIGLLVFWARTVKYQEKVDKLEEFKKEISQKNDVLRSDMDKLLEFRIYAQKFIDNKLYEAKSPLGLSAFGEKIVKESGFVKIFDQCKDDLCSKLEVLHPKTKYDVQEKARALMDQLGNYEPFQVIKTYAFNNGIDFLQILRAGSILLRDYYFKKHLEIQE